METITLEQMYYMGELIGVIAVIASLIYVGKQLRQNTETMRVNAAHTYVEWFNEMLSRVMNNREVAELWIKGDSDFDSLDYVDKQRLLQHEIGAINMWEYLFSLHQQNLLPEARWQLLKWSFKNFGGRQSLHEAWKFSRGGFDKSFQDFMGQYLK
jgi:hypothetical protein